MNENIDLTKILKDCPEGTKLYSPLFGEVDFQKIRNDDECAIVVTKGVIEDSFTKEGFYYADLGDECILFPSRDQRDWSKFTAPWYKKEKLVELKESEDEKIKNAILNHLKKMWGNSQDDVCGVHVEDAIDWLEKQGKKPTDKPRFNVGDWVVNDCCRGRVVELTDDAYMLDTGQGIPFSCEHNVHLWTIQDAKDGDVLCRKSGWMCIFKAINIHTNTFSSYCFMDSDKRFFNIGIEGHTLDKEFIKAYNGEIYPATKEQRDDLMKAINDSVYEWDAEKKKLKKLVHNRFDPKTLKAFDRVLVRSYGTAKWKCDHFSFIQEDFVHHYVASASYAYCIPYNEETKHLVGTMDEAPEYYRYWEDQL